MKRMHMTWTAPLVIGIAAIGIAASGWAQASSAEDAPENGPLHIDEATQKSLGIVTATIAPRIAGAELRAPGEVKANAYATTLVSPRVPAQVVRRHARLGDDVKAGQPLVALSSVEVAEAQGTLIVAERDWQRVRALGADAVSAKRYTEAQVARDQAYAKLRAYGVTATEIAALQRKGSRGADGEFALVAPQDGRVISDAFVVGERIEPGRNLFTLVDESSVWIEAQLAPAVSARMRTGASVRVVAHGQTMQGNVIQLAHRTDENSRTAPVRIEVANANDALHTGEFVDVFIATGEEAPVLGVADAALVQLQGQTVVFKREADGAFEPVPVDAGDARGGFTQIKRGVVAGDVVVVDGAYELKARLLKSQLGEGHGH